MSVLLLRLAGPMQSWGTQSRFSVRDTGLEPSKSGVIGLLAAALGWQRKEESFSLVGRDWTPEKLARTLTMAVRVDRQGRMARDYHTAMQVTKADGSKPDTVTSSRYYLADADFLVGLSGDHALLNELDNALRAPHWPLYLGRKAFVPSRPVRVGPPIEGTDPTALSGSMSRPVHVDTRIERELVSVMEKQPWFRRSWEQAPDRLRWVIETGFGQGDQVRQDVPLSFTDRRFAVRHVCMKFHAPQCVETDPCCI